MNGLAKPRNPSWTRLLRVDVSFNLEIARHTRALADALTALTYSLGNLDVRICGTNTRSALAIIVVRELVEAIDDALRALEQRLLRTRDPKRPAAAVQHVLQSAGSAMQELHAFLGGNDAGDAKECAAALRGWIVTIASLRDRLIRSTPRLLSRW